MLPLQEILSVPMTAQEYLTEKREKCREKYEKTAAALQKKGENGAYREDLLRRAEDYMQNMYILPGTGGKLFFVGDPPAWNERKVADEEYLWGLNRMMGLPVLSDAYLLTGEERYAQKALSDLLNWIDTCPCPEIFIDDGNYLWDAFHNIVDISPWRTLEIGIRMFRSWNEAYEKLLYFGGMTPECHARIASSMHQHGHALSFVSPRLWPNADHNHFIHEMLGLLSVSLLFPEWQDAEKWHEQALHELIRCCRVQFSSEGGPEEGCPGYHMGNISMVLKAMEMLKENGRKIPEELESSFHKAMRYAIWMMQPDGKMTAFGDTAMKDGGCPALLNRYRQMAGDFGEYGKVLPLMERRAEGDISKEEYAIAEREAASCPGGLQHYRAIGQIAGRTGWGKQDSYFAATCHTPTAYGHTHMDPLSFVLTLRGKNIVIDPSIYTYAEGEDRRRFKSTEYHSCLTFGGRPPFEYINTWTYGPMKEGTTEGVYQAEGLLAADASHKNYAPNEHRRLYALAGDDVFLVADDVKNATGEAVRLHFHMDEAGWQKQAFGASCGGVRAFLPEGLEVWVAEGEKSPQYGLALPSCRLIAKDESGREQAVYLTLFTLRDDVASPCARHAEGGVEIRYRQGNEEKILMWQFGKSCRMWADTAGKT
ncbi:MAG: hypothetical protein E7324_07325 [Clostridiales bacterium]|nr:hypothetical protein [Clostridiales bacterium]